MSRTMLRGLAALLALTLLAAACGDDDDGDAGSDDTVEDTGGEGAGGDVGDDGDDAAADIDFEAIGLWDDGPCDEAMEPLKIGLMTTFESPVISLGDQAIALEAAAEGFNNRGGANGACIEVVTCDDGANVDQAIECVRELDEAGVVATVNDQGTAGHAEVSEAMASAGIPRVAGNVTNFDWGDPNAYPMDASGTGSTFMMPQGLVSAGVTDIGIIRVDSPGAGALLGLLEGVFEDATFPVDVPVPAGTTDFSQFVLAAQDGDAGGIVLAIGEQEAVQVVRAAQQLGSDLRVSATLGTFSHSAVTDFGDFAEQMVFVWSFPPATADLPVYEALRADMEASGEDGLKVENLKASPMRSWIGLYALLHMIRESGMTDFTRDGITAMLQETAPVPMLDIFGGEDWEPNKDHDGLFKRAGLNHWAAYEWDPTAEAPGGLEGNWTEIDTFSFDEVLCGSVIGPPEPCA